MWTLLIFLWIVSGWVSVVWLVTQNNDFLKKDLIGTFFFGFFGPIVPAAVSIVRAIDRITSDSAVIFKKRGSK